MSPATPTTVKQPRQRDTGEKLGRGTSTSYSARKREDPSIPPLAAASAAPAPETVYNRWYKSPEDKVAAFNLEVTRMKGCLGTAEAWSKLLGSMAKFPHMSLENVLVLGDQDNGSVTRVAKYVKWQALGRQVAHGQRGMSILDTKQVPVALMDNAGNPQLDAMGAPRREFRRTDQPTTSTVFDISQTEGPTLRPQRKLTSAPPAGLINDLKQAVVDLGFTIVYASIDEPGVLGYTTLDGEPRVVIREGASSTSVARALAHELGHITAGHVYRADYTDGHGSADGQAEAEAHSIAYTLLVANGMKGDPAYGPQQIIASWSNPDAGQVEAAAGAVHQAVRGLFIEARWTNA